MTDTHDPKNGDARPQKCGFPIQIWSGTYNTWCGLPKDHGGNHENADLIADPTGRRVIEWKPL